MLACTDDSLKYSDAKTRHSFTWRSPSGISDVSAVSYRKTVESTGSFTVIRDSKSRSDDEHVRSSIKILVLIMEHIHCDGREGAIPWYLRSRFNLDILDQYLRFWTDKIFSK